MTAQPAAIRRLHTVADREIVQLAELLIDSVDGGATVTFLHPLSMERATAFWRTVADGAAKGTRALLVAEDTQGICGTVQVLLEMPENQPHRGEIAKLLVHRRARRRGLAEALMRAAESLAAELSKTLLVLDTVDGGDAERLYTRLGWQRVGVIPAFAVSPGGEQTGAAIFYKAIG